MGHSEPSASYESKLAGALGRSLLAILNGTPRSLGARARAARMAGTPDWLSKRAAVKTHVNSFDGNDFAYGSLRNHTKPIGLLTAASFYSKSLRCLPWTTGPKRPQLLLNILRRNIWTQIAYGSLRTPRFCLRQPRFCHPMSSLLFGSFDLCSDGVWLDGYPTWESPRSRPKPAEPSQRLKPCEEIPRAKFDQLPCTDQARIFPLSKDEADVLIRGKVHTSKWQGSMLGTLSAPRSVAVEFYNTCPPLVGELLPSNVRSKPAFQLRAICRRAHETSLPL